MLVLTISKKQSLNNLLQGLELLEKKILSNKSKINPGTTGAGDLHLYYQEKFNEIELDKIALIKLIDKNFKVPHFYCAKNELGKDTICTQQCENCKTNNI